jgi:hypothetical protein
MNPSKKALWELPWNRLQKPLACFLKWTLLSATGPLIGWSEYFISAYTWLQPWEFIPSIAGFVGLPLPLWCGYSPLHVFSSDNSCYPAAFPNFLFFCVFRGLELLVPHCAGRTNQVHTAAQPERAASGANEDYNNIGLMIIFLKKEKLGWLSIFY